MNARALRQPETPLGAQIRCVKREIEMRVVLYPQWVAQHKMTQAKADGEIATMRAVLDTLHRVAARLDDGK